MDKYKVNILDVREPSEIQLFGNIQLPNGSNATVTCITLEDLRYGIYLN